MGRWYFTDAQGRWRKLTETPGTHPAYIVVCAPTIYVETEVRGCQRDLADAKIGHKAALETEIYAKQVGHF